MRPKARHPRCRIGTSSAAEALAVLIAVLMSQSGSMATAHALESKLCPSAPLRPRRESAALLVRLRLVWARAARVRFRVGVRVRVRVRVKARVRVRVRARARVRARVRVSSVSPEGG